MQEVIISDDQYDFLNSIHWPSSAKTTCLNNHQLLPPRSKEDKDYDVIVFDGTALHMCLYCFDQRLPNAFFYNPELEVDYQVIDRIK